MVHVDDERRRALLATRLLSGDADRATSGVREVAGRLGPLHSTDPATAYLQVHARSHAGVADVDRALYDDRSLLRHTTLRRTVHLLPLDLVAPAHRSYNHRLVRESRRTIARWIEQSDDVADDVDAAAWLAALEEEVVAAVTALDRPSGARLAEEVPRLRTTFDPAPGKSYSRPTRLTSFVLQLVIADGRVARDRPLGDDFTSGAWTYAPIERWLPGGIEELPASDALAELVRHHLGAFAASSVVDLAWWTGLPKGRIRRALAAIAAAPVRRDDGEEGFVLPGDELAVVDLDQDPRVVLLPGLDATPMGFKERAFFLGPHEAALFDRNGNVGPTVWCRGRVVGGWTQREDGEVVTRLLDDVGTDAEAAIAAEAGRTQRWLGEVRVRWRYPTPLQRELEEP